ncbi:AAA family ATPase [Paraburkholderia bryophila]|uniref:AAA ATPase-like protein n=1 Tax=Paraburkholderia bryophila TaxID=420952 RepID=A0A7Y9WNK0_9BURK|nr:AAA family ATPase [Paraburkholderia bryophila]NYH23837.1 hypothetical protein [Paraburkholderia bryophila]
MTASIRSLALKNFKCFSDEVRIELRPITLLFGVNSAGKSSVLQALQYMREILDRHNTNADRTLQGGEVVDLGGFLNLVHGRDLQRTIEIEVGMQLGVTSIPELVPESFDEWQTSDEGVWGVYNTLQSVRTKVESVSVRLSVAWNEQREQPIVQSYQVITNGVWCVHIESSGDGRDVRMRLNRENPIFMAEAPDPDAELAELLDFVDPLDLGGDSDPTSEPEVEGNATSSTSAGLRSVLPDIFLAVEEAGMERPGDGLRGWLSGFRGALPQLNRVLNIPAPGAKGAENVYIVREFTAFLSWLTVGPALLLRNELRELRYIGPLRRIPPRGFDVALTKSESAWSNGMAAWETLLTGSEDLVERVSDWMQSADKLATGYAVTREPVQEFNPAQPVPQPVGPVRKRTRLVDAAGLAHQPQDVGVGISQVLPVVVAAQDGNASVVCIEQPELHIHPAVQVGLGDLFIDGAMNQELSFLIETHSEHLILRLLRRIREAAEVTSETLGQQLTPELLGVYCLNKRNGVVWIDKVPVTSTGDFAKPWPQGFFDERGAELF